MSAVKVVLPALGESVTEGTVTQWLKSVGDEVKEDEPLLEVSTDKVDTEIPSPFAGTLLEILVAEDETVEVGTELALVGEPEQADEAPSAAKDEDVDPTPAQAEAAPTPDSAPSAESAPAARPHVTPLVRKLAAQHGVDLSAVEGTGVGGRIRKHDILEAAATAAATAPRAATTTTKAVDTSARVEAPATGSENPATKSAGRVESAAATPSHELRGRSEKMTRLRKVIAKRMVESLQVSAQLTTVVEVDVTPISRLRDAHKADFAAREGVKLSYMPFFAKAAIDALKAHPSINAWIDTDKGEVVYYDYENVAIAVDTEKGLLTPVIKNAGDLSVSGLARKIADLADRTRANRISPDELSGGTFTLSNTGSRGALFDTPIINQPQVAILGTGSVVKRPVVIDHPDLGEIIAVRRMVYFALTYDHRLVDGADAARFLADVKQRLETGHFEL